MSASEPSKPEHPIRRMDVVLFAYNERGNLGRLLEDVHRVMTAQYPAIALHYALCIQGHDGTLDEARAFAETLKPPHGLHLTHAPEPIGIRGACLEAFALAAPDTDAYLMMDCDRNHQAGDIPRLMEAAAPHTVVIGSRFVRGGRIIGMPLWKRVLSMAFNTFSSLAIRVPVKDKTSGFRIVMGSDAPAIARDVTGTGFDFYIEFLLHLLRHGYQVREVPIEFRARTEGKSKMRILPTFRDYFRLLLRLRRYDPRNHQHHP